jgi:leader peptidase (prepilin peptidase) / N-methyltransferase
VTPAILALLLGGSGLIVGGGLARVSLGLPGGDAAVGPTPRRLAMMTLAAAGLGVWAGLAQPTTTAAVLTALLGWQLLLIAVIDAEHFRLPDALTLPLLASGSLAAVLLAHTAPLDAVIGAATGFAGLWLLAFAYRRLRGRDGLGDGGPILLAAGGAWARWLVGRKVSGSDRLPFGPCLTLGIWLTWMIGPLGF